MSDQNDRGRVLGQAPGQPEFRILIVEDETQNALLLRRLLEDAAFLVRTAEDGEQAVEMFQGWRPHFIWMDLRLPTIGGLEAVRRIRALDGGRHVKIVALTASAYTEQRKEVLAEGLDGFVRKPYRREEIFDCMTCHLGVRYVRAEDAPRPAAQAKAALRPEALAALPEKLREDLANALIALDVERVAGLIRGISAVDPALEGVLADFAGRFAYTPILKALQGYRPDATGVVFP